METRHPQRPAYQDDDGLWMKLDFNHETDHTEKTKGSTSLTSDGRSQDDTKVAPSASAQIRTYYSVMDDDEGTDDVFMWNTPPLPPSYIAPSLPTEGSTGSTVPTIINSSVTLLNEVIDVTEAKANLSRLEWCRGEKHLMTAQPEVDEVAVSMAQMNTSEECLDTFYQFSDKDSTQPEEEEEETTTEASVLTETRSDQSGRYQQDHSTGCRREDEGSNEEPEDILIWNEGFKFMQENPSEENCMEREKYPKQTSNMEENSENETDCETLQTEGGKIGKDKSIESLGKSEDICGFEQTDSILRAESGNYNTVETNDSKLRDLSVNDNDFDFPIQKESPELNRSNQIETDAAVTNQPDGPESPAELTDDDEEHAGNQAFNYRVTPEDGVRSDSATSETQVSQFPVSTCSSIHNTPEPLSPPDEQKAEHEGNRRVATDIQQGEELLQRLQLVQQRHDIHISDDHPTSQQVVHETANETRDEEAERGVFAFEEDDLRRRGEDVKDEEQKEESRFQAVKVDGAKTNQEEGKRESVEIERKPVTSLAAQHRIFRIKTIKSEDDQKHSEVSADLPPINTLETSSTQIQSTCQ
ncbi:hypothetical protein LDENG_00123310 [Lucifuga dentata]|nr:hypothetical protein LDENG_00123310 [Lucifuga dentata]